MRTELIPAILSNDESDFRKKYADLLVLAMQGFFTKLHIDFIDGEFLPNKTLLPADLTFLHSHLTLIAHFMTFDPEQYFEQIVKLGFNTAIIHFESYKSDKEIINALNHGRTLGLKMGLAINPETKLHKTAKVLPNAELIQLMGVHPGAQGREFIPETLQRIKELKDLTRNVIISVDGGERLDLINQCKAAGADWIVVGSALIQSTHPKEVLEAFKRELELA